MEGFRVVIDVPIAWGEMDAFGHVNNIVYFRWFESARIAYFDRIGFRVPEHNDGVGPILASTQCRFRKPLSYPGMVTIGTRVTELLDDRFTMEYRVQDNSGAVAAEGTGLVVAYHYARARKAPVPALIAERIRALDLAPA